MGVAVVMVSPENRLFCRLDGLTPAAREQQRFNTISDLGLLEADTIPVFEEATQTAARLLEAPICILGLMMPEQLLFKATVGLSRVGLMNELAVSRQIPRDQSFSNYVVDSHQVLLINNTLTNPVFANSMLVQHYGIRAYLGAPLVTASGQCIGAIAVMDLVERNFTSKDIEFLELIARWSLSEFERTQLLKNERKPSTYPLQKSSLGGDRKQSWEYNSSKNTPECLPVTSNNLAINQPTANPIKVKLLTQLAEELRTPLTSVMGMASVLGREIYGPLTNKQKEYLEIIHNSGQHLVSLVDEILGMGVIDENNQKLNLSSVDIEMLCQQAINSLSKVAKARQQQIRLSVEPGNRIWLLDKDKVRQMLYYLVFNIIQSAETGGVVRIHVSRKHERLNIAVWVSHPWLGDGLPQVEFYSHSSVPALTNGSETALNSSYTEGKELATSVLSPSNQLLSSSSGSSAVGLMEGLNQYLVNNNNSRENLGLLLSCQLVELHKGQISVQGSPESGCRYVVSLPLMTTIDEKS